MSAPRLLLYTPTYGDALRPETVAAVATMRAAWPGVSRWEVGRANPYPVGDMRNVVGKYMQAREMALSGGRDALVTIEHDMGPPADALRLLWNAPGEVVFGVYMFRHGAHVLNALRLEGVRNIGQSVSLYRSELRRARRAGVWPVSGVGWGCTLIRRSVLEAIPFRYAGPHDAGDLAFAADCLRAGVVMMAHFGVPCLHYEGDQVLAPWAENNGMVPVEALADVTIAVDGQGVRLVAGQRYDLPVDAALMHQRAGYVRLDLPAAPVGRPVDVPPLLEVLTRTNGRPHLLAINQASLAAQTVGDWKQTLLIDGQSRGIGWSYERLADYADKIVGAYVWILDDDDVCTRPTLVAELADIVERQAPDVIMVRMDHGAPYGVLPGDAWGREPAQGEIGVSAYIVRRAVWQAHASAMRPGHYASDFEFIRSILRGGATVYWHDVIASSALQIGHGRPETGIEHAIDANVVHAERRTDWGEALVSALDGIGPVTAQRLAEAGIETLSELLAADPTHVALIASVKPIQVEKWRQRAESLGAT